MSHIAFADRAGVIGFGLRCPTGALSIAKYSNLELLKSAVAAVARLAHDNETLLVPGLPEASNSDHAIRALVKFGETVRSRLQAVST
ncbi:hypothetical protein M2323_004159 [Rhodoblastus acidophilus]|uniref:hypothetical protein n=1 Tax=Rhodoblastus acidophilus TaxID=1074 RepID=UPI0022248A83|nr:hypothetical protein [Rhodoblastus acidophilus]MCW2286318.1 hypothetical protein [Rhodoblastus acidophilus]MCW2335213.1 hypothetical protein [Rhodoblastus acidophilus]